MGIVYSQSVTSMRIMSKSFGCCVDFLAFVHGSFHWIAMSNCCTIYSLSISRYVLGEIPLLEQMRNTPDLKLDNLGVIVLKGMLCFYQTYTDFSCLYAKGIFKLWVMKDYGVKESWMMSLSVEAGLFYAHPCIQMVKC